MPQPPWQQAPAVVVRYALTRRQRRNQPAAASRRANTALARTRDLKNRQVSGANSQSAQPLDARSQRGGRDSVVHDMDRLPGLAPLAHVDRRQGALAVHDQGAPSGMPNLARPRDREERQWTEHLDAARQGQHADQRVEKVAPRVTSV